MLAVTTVTGVPDDNGFLYGSIAHITLQPYEQVYLVSAEQNGGPDSFCDSTSTAQPHDGMLAAICAVYFFEGAWFPNLADGHLYGPVTALFLQ